MKHVHYNFVSSFVISAPKAAVWNELINYQDWKKWWKPVKKIVPIRAEPPQCFTISIGTILYALTFTLTATDNKKKNEITIISVGDLVGMGRFTLTEVPEGTKVVFMWDVATTKKWMNVFAPILKPIFIYSHHIVMHQFGAGLAKQVHGIVQKESHT